MTHHHTRVNPFDSLPARIAPDRDVSTRASSSAPIQGPSTEPRWQPDCGSGARPAAFVATTRRRRRYRAQDGVVSADGVDWAPAVELSVGREPAKSHQSLLNEGARFQQGESPQTSWQQQLLQEALNRGQPRPNVFQSRPPERRSRTPFRSSRTSRIESALPGRIALPWPVAVRVCFQASTLSPWSIDVARGFASLDSRCGASRSAARRGPTRAYSPTNAFAMLSAW
jgi:hypothetical protein